MTSSARTVEVEKDLTATEHSRLMQNIQSVTGKVESFDAWEAKVQRHPVTGRILRHSDGDGTDASLEVRFTIEKVLHKLKTYEAGGEPTYQEMEFITITVPGRKDLSVHAPVNPYYEWRFRKEYEAFKNGAVSFKGTDLSKLERVTAADIRVLNQLGVYSVEQLANLSDATSNNVNGFYDMRSRAQKFLATQESPEQAATNARLSKQDETIALLTKQLEAQTKLLEKLAGERETSKKGDK